MGFYEARGNRPVVITLVVCACCDIKKICASIGILVSLSSGGSPSRHSRWPGDLSIAMSWSTISWPTSVAVPMGFGFDRCCAARVIVHRVGVPESLSALSVVCL